MAESKRKAGYTGNWNHQYTPYATLITKLEDLQDNQKSLHQFYRNMIIFVLLFLHSFQSLNPSKRRGLIDSSIETFINTPFETERLDPRLTSATLNVDAPVVSRVNSFLDIKTDNEYWSWVHNVLSSSIYNNAMSFDKYNRVLWGVRFRQIRMASQEEADASYEHVHATSSGKYVACDPTALPPLILLANITGIACKYNYNDALRVLEKDFGHPSTRIEENARGQPVNVTSEEWTWKPDSYGEGQIEMTSSFGDFTYDNSGFFVDLPLNGTTASKKIYAMQYGRHANGEVITSALEANQKVEQSKKTKFLSDQTVVLVVTVQAFNSGNGFVVHNNFIFERSLVGKIITKHQVHAGKLSSRECADGLSAFTDLIGVLLAIAAIFYALMVLNDLRSGGHHMTSMLVVDLINVGLLMIHVWWETRKLVFSVDYSLFMDAVTVSSVNSTGAAAAAAAATVQPIDNVLNFIDLQYYLIWDQFANMCLGVNLILFFIRLLALMEIHPVSKVFYETFYNTVSFIFWGGGGVWKTYFFGGDEQTMNSNPDLHVPRFVKLCIFC